MPLIVTPSQIQASADALNADFLRVAADVESADVDGGFKSAFAAFSDAWFGFYAELSDSYVERLWGGTQEQIDGYRAQLVQWQAKLVGAGARTTGPTVAPPDAPFNPFSALPELKWILLAGAALVLVLVYARSKS